MRDTTERMGSWVFSCTIELVPARSQSLLSPTDSATVVLTEFYDNGKMFLPFHSYGGACGKQRSKTDRIPYGRSSWTSFEHVLQNMIHGYENFTKAVTCRCVGVEV